MSQKGLGYRVRCQVERNGVIYFALILWIGLSIAHFLFELAVYGNEYGGVDWLKFTMSWTADYIDNIMGASFMLLIGTWFVGRKTSREAWFTSLAQRDPPPLREQ